jgi:hypothetical protein
MLRALIVITVAWSSAIAAGTATLPIAWHGSWSGTLKMGDGDTAKEVPLKLVIEPIKDSSRIRWQITYGEGDRKSVRDYELVPDAKNPHVFALDEKNGITLAMTLLNGVLYSQFDVGGRVLAGRYELRDSKVYYEITSSDKATETGGQGNVPKVLVYPVINVQSAVLSKSN